MVIDLRVVARGESMTIFDRWRPVAQLTRRLPRAKASVQRALLGGREDRFQDEPRALLGSVAGRGAARTALNEMTAA